MSYSEANYWRAIQEQERAEEEARWIAKCELEDRLNAQVQKTQKRIWTEDEIRNLVQTNDTMLYRSLIKLYECQTADEKASGSTQVHNGKGFNSVDAKFLTSVAEFLNRTGFLTDKQKVLTRKKLIKYTKQLTGIANA